MHQSLLEIEKLCTEMQQLIVNICWIMSIFMAVVAAAGQLWLIHSEKKAFQPRERLDAEPVLCPSPGWIAPILHWLHPTAKQGKAGLTRMARS